MWQQNQTQHEPAPHCPAPSYKGAIWLGTLALFLTIVFCVAVIYFWEEVRALQSYGLVGVVLINILAGATMIVPVPGLLVTFTMGSVLHPALVGLASGFGEALGALVIYFTGCGGRAIVSRSNHPLVLRMVNWVRKRGMVACFTMSAIFNPFFYPVTLAIGALRFKAWKFFLATWAGKTVKGFIVAYLGYLGLGSILRAFGIPI